MTYLGNVLIWWFLLFFSLLSTGISAQDSRPEIIESDRSLDCEYVSAILDSFVQGSPRDVPIIAIASAGKTERVSLVRQRLNQLRTHLLNYYSGTPWQRSSENVVTAMSSQLSDEGTLDLYSGGKLRLRIFVRKNRLIRLSPCVTEKPEARIASESPRGTFWRADDRPYGNVKLLEGYKYRRSQTSDTINGLIYRDGGLRIEFESGTGAGYGADPKKQRNYYWFRQQEIQGHIVYLALADIGVGTKWQPSRRRSRNPGRAVIVTFPGTMSSLDAANFYGEVLSDTEIAEALLMILTFDPTL